MFILVILRRDTMIRHTILLLFLYGISSSTGRPQNEVAEAREEIQRERIKESEVGANGSGDVIFRNFQNPVLEYLKLSRGEPRKNGIIREVRHGQTLLLPGGSLPISEKEETKLATEGAQIPEKSVMSPVLQINKTEGLWTKTETFPAAAVVVSTYNRDGNLMSSVTHYRPLGVPANFGPSLPRPQTINYGMKLPPAQRISWPFANYFPVVINDPFLAAYNGISSSMYNTFSTIIEYGPEADICRKKESRKSGEEVDEVTLDAEVKLIKPSTEKSKESRKKRDTTGIELSFKNGDRVNVKVEAPKFRSLLRKAGQSDLVLRKGGIAIAGPGGAATAYSGGTAIVGPYGTVYKSPAGTAILGPYSRVVNITDDMTFEEILRLHQGQGQSPSARATGFKNYKNYFSYWTDLPINIEDRGISRWANGGPVVTVSSSDLEKISEEATREITVDGVQDERTPGSNDTVLVFRPKAKAEAGRKGVALSSPISHAVVFPNQRVTIKFEPDSVASAGPGGFAHAHSDLFLSYLYRRGVVLPAEAEERTRAHTVMLVNPPPISSLLKPGLNMKKKGTKPSKFEKEGSESGSEEIGEETEDAAQSGTNGTNDGIAISPPPDGASVAEAKPVGLAIAGPGGLAAAKPQGTAVAGPGGLAIARPIGTAIAGVEVEGAVPIGGQQKNKNKNKQPKQDAEKMEDDAESELHYVGGLTGPIGNPQPNTKDFGKESPVKSRSQENLLFQGKYNNNMYQLKLGEQDGKYGFLPYMSSPLGTADRIQKRMDNPTFFHGLLGNRNFQGHHLQGQMYPDFYY